MKDHDSISKVCFVIVVNSWADTDKTIINNFISASSISVILFQPNKNLGYMNGLIHGYRYYRDIYGIPKYVVMSNTDIEIPDREYYSRLLNMEYGADVGCIGPSVYVKEKNTYDNPVCEERRTKKEVDKIIKIFSNPYLGGTYYYLSTLKGHFIKSKKTGSRFVYEVHGCYFILTGIFAEKIKDLEYGVLLYSEESYIAELVYKFGMKAYFDSTIEVVHLEHSTTKFIKCSKISKYMHESMTYIRDEFYK